MSKGNSGLFIGTKGSKQENKASKPLLNQNLSKEKNELIQKVIDQGHKISPDKVLDIGTMPNGKIVWIEIGKLGERASGLAHILDKHNNELNNLGISNKDVPSFIIKVLAKNKVVGIQGEQNDFPRSIYETEVNKKIVYVAISVLENGYIVGANLISKYKIKEKIK